MDCRSCGVVNAPGRRYCRECGTRLGEPCPVCHFFNAAEDRHCGGCGRRLRSGVGIIEPSLAGVPSHVPAFAGDEEAGSALAAAGSGAGAAAEPSVSQSEIDGLFENILDDEPEDSPEGGA